MRVYDRMAFFYFMFLHGVCKITKCQERNIRPKYVNMKRLPSDDEANMHLCRFIDAGTPFCLLRPGNGEYSVAHEWIEHELVRDKRYKRQKMYNSILDRDDDVTKQWVDGFLSDLGEADILASIAEPVYSLHYLAKVYSPHSLYVMATVLRPWNENLIDPWYKHLKGKRVLFVSPFADIMESQWRIYDKICGEYECMPYDMTPIFFKAEWYLGKDDKWDNWFSALHYMQSKIREINFDIALVSCGPFGTFVAADIKRSGRSAIQAGGWMQLHFGIRGKRWDESHEFDTYINKYWVRPEAKDRPNQYKLLDNGCYW